MTDLKRSITIIRNEKKLLQQDEESQLAKRMLISKFQELNPNHSLHEMIKSGVLLAKLCNIFSQKQIVIQYKNHNMYYLENLAQVKRRLLEFGLKETQIFDPQDLLKPEPRYALHLVSLLIFAIQSKTHVFNPSAEDIEALECIDSTSTINLDIQVVDYFDKNDVLSPVISLENALLTDEQINIQEPVISQENALLTVEQTEFIPFEAVQQLMDVNLVELQAGIYKLQKQEENIVDEIQVRNITDELQKDNDLIDIQAQNITEQINEQQVEQEQVKVPVIDPQDNNYSQIKNSDMGQDINQVEMQGIGEQQDQQKRKELSIIEKITIQFSQRSIAQQIQVRSSHPKNIEILQQHIIDQISLPPPSADLQTISYKLVFLGDSSTGKSSICKRLLNQNINNISATIDLEQHRLQFRSPYKPININLTLQDTAGMERFRSVSQQYVRSADVVVLVYSLIEPETVSGAVRWFEFVKRNNLNAKIILVGNKSEKATSSECLKRSDELTLQELGADKFLKCSAVTGEGIEDILNIEWPDKEETKQLQVSEEKEKKGCCK
ncbi:Rab11 [Hexamita inflata]|uniref:Rab11 n=1 Tax=Hexamita inflata TaxID=28002 RepID=A0AA86QG06_9EUKA|nr:Rab11 [Hexamita inflata]